MTSGNEEVASDADGLCELLEVKCDSVCYESELMLVPVVGLELDLRFFRNPVLRYYQPPREASGLIAVERP
jgi:hypothetical protein